MERLLTPELKASSITLTNCKILQGPEIADHAFALLPALTRELHRIVPRRTTEEWAGRAYNPLDDFQAVAHSARRTRMNEN